MKIKRNKTILSILLIAALLFGVFKAMNGMDMLYGSEASATSNLSDSSKVVEFRFLNTQRYVNTNNESNIIKTLDNKYVVIDTANKDEGVYNEIYNALVDYQGSEEVVIDYLVISHFHSDHYGNAVAIIQNENITIRNLVVKYEREVYASYALDKKPFREIILSAVDRGIENIYTSSNVTDAIRNNTLMGDIFTSDEVAQYEFFKNHYKVLEEGEEIAAGNYVKLGFYNTDDIFTGKECKNGLILVFTASRNVVVNGGNTFNGKYVYFDGAEYPNVTLRATDTFITKNSETSGMNRYFYATYKEADGDERMKKTCNSNPNSLGILVSVKNNSEDKYVYYANDLENSGYSIFPEDDVYGDGYTVFYDSDELGFDEQSHSFTGLIEVPKIPAESDVANAIRGKIGVGNLNNLVIYQQSHHSLNDAPDAVNSLDINRASGIYAIANTNADPGGTNVNGFSATRSYWYTLDEIPADNKMYTGKIEDGASCTISASGDTDCKYEELTYDKKTVEFDANNGDGVVESEYCVISSLNNVCQVNAPNLLLEKDGHIFKGWADSADATIAQYSDRGGIILSDDMKLYAVWGVDDADEPDTDGNTDDVAVPDTGNNTKNGKDMILGTISFVLPIISVVLFSGVLVHKRNKDHRKFEL